jgi:hypothetical protein
LQEFGDARLASHIGMRAHMWWNSIDQWKTVSWPIKLLVLLCVLAVCVKLALIAF